MGKPNRPHHHKKDRKHKRERSKKEHYLRKEKEEKTNKIKHIEETRYDFDEASLKKLLKVLRDLIAYSNEAAQAVVQVFQMLDEDQELEITDIEDGKLREALEKIFGLFNKQVEEKEDNDGRVAYFKSGKKSLKEQISAFFDKAKSAPNVDHIAELFTGTVEKDLNIVERKKKNKEIGVSQNEELRIRGEIEKYNLEKRPMTLMEMHQSKNSGKKSGSSISAEVFGNKSLNKRFSGGKFLN